ncbi:MAG: hypothetical protein HN742_06155 [Lentisphaerae bacterium]|jgi:hypothetical protein|nr:hypothetical protein [Lentisphaerota bacterium]MBT4820018.1 hypothetical protein [Lentisphaerota bacterium]MBT5612089.1 hypothetical protein [Lentisphaerota bacterium]MBT7060937.1 hypothetical protein [Lentisphaerota bacterium]MBT7841433.1 hypothetical protein [Lentisphaerota bacterium]
MSRNSTACMQSFRRTLTTIVCSATILAQTATAGWSSVVVSDSEMQALKEKQEHADARRTTLPCRALRLQSRQSRTMSVSHEVTLRPSVQQAVASALTIEIGRRFLPDLDLPICRGNRVSARREARASVNGLGLRREMDAGSGSASDVFALEAGADVTWQVTNGAWTGGTVTWDEIRCALQHARRAGVRLNSVRVIVGTRREQSEVEREFERIGLARHVIVGRKSGVAPRVSLTLRRS